MLLRVSQLQTLGSQIGGSHAITSRMKLTEVEWIAGVQQFGNEVGYPQGYAAKSFVMPLKAGSISTNDKLSITTSASAAMGVNAEASASVSTFMANADLELIVSGYGEANIALGASGSVVASLSGQASSSFTITMNHLAMYVDAFGFASANLNLLTESNGSLSATAACIGSTVDTSGLTPASIWRYANRTLTSIDVEVSGLTAEQAAQLNSIDSVTKLIPALL
jgi:hypothetical protein